MGEKEAKIATVIITVDHERCCSSVKINCALGQLQKQFNINSIVFDEKKNTVTVSGAFNPDDFIKAIRCLAHNAIKNIEIKKPEPKPPAEKPKPPPKVDVNVSISFCCQPCSCYHPHRGCCCSCSCYGGHMSYGC